jgi:hypothetical protein
MIACFLCPLVWLQRWDVPSLRYSCKVFNRYLVTGRAHEGSKEPMCVIVAAAFVVDVVGVWVLSDLVVHLVQYGLKLSIIDELVIILFADFTSTLV